MRVLITRPEKDSRSMAEALAAIGAQPIYFPAIRIAPPPDLAPLDEALKHLNRFAWVVFTSANAVQAFFERAYKHGVTIPLNSPKIAAVGPKTASTILRYGFTPRFVPDEFTGEAIPAGMGDVTGKCILLPLADIAPDTLENNLAALGAVPERVTAYTTLPAEIDPEGLAAIKEGVDVLTFTSGSAARNFAALAARTGLDPFKLPNSPITACIGPKTAAAAKEAGFTIDIVAETYTVEGLAAAIKRFFTPEPNS